MKPSRKSGIKIKIYFMLVFVPYVLCTYFGLDGWIGGCVDGLGWTKT